MLLAHILLAVASLGLASHAASTPHAHKTLIASVASFVAAFASGVFLQTSNGGLSLHGVSMLVAFTVIYGLIVGVAVRKQTKQFQK